MSDLITADLVLLDENLGETRFDVIAKLAQAVVNAGRATDFEQLYAAAEHANPRLTPASPAVLRFLTAVAPPSPSRPWQWHAPTRQFPSVQRTAPPT